MDRHIPFSRLRNFRDLGGYPTQDGRLRVRPGRLYRAGSLGGLSEGTPDWDRGPRPPDAGYIHRLMTTPHTAPPGTGRRMLREAESRIAATGRPYARLDCLAANPRLRAYYESAGYRVVGERPVEDGGTGSPYAVTLLEKRLN
ncbi:tyrosine-protein phosphatase [Streptomyces sp. NPDC006739]|uniref:tyrosine-protein phosphatase n=1 Tax=Streptomyces sp. NPDC006739 TaxID=3364763 RepID=UPI00369A2633